MGQNEEGYYLKEMCDVTNVSDWLLVDGTNGCNSRGWDQNAKVRLKCVSGEAHALCTQAFVSMLRNVRNAFARSRMTTPAETSTSAVLAASQPAFVDAHCHLHDPRFLQPQQDSLQAVITRARAANVRHIVSCACFEDDWAALEKLLSTWEQCSRVEDGSAQGSVQLTPSFGVHPWWAQSKRDDYLELLRAKLEQYPTASVRIKSASICETWRYRNTKRPIPNL